MSRARHELALGERLTHGPQVAGRPPTSEEISLALSRYPGLEGAATRSFGGGLINATFLVEATQGRFVLQRLNPVFAPEVHLNIEAVTRRLDEAGIETPRLVPAADGRAWIELGDAGVWRVQTFVEGESHDTVQSPAQAEAAAHLIGRFHAALDDLDHEFVGMRVGVHDTDKHLARLEAAVREHGDHRLFGAVAPLATEILAAARALEPLPALPDRPCHGDLKFNNVRFGPDGAPRCLIDLDTVGPMMLAHELGDAFRSWCNRSPEDAQSIELDLDVLAAFVRGYEPGLGRSLTVEERRGALLGLDWIALELSARFAADALFESYFGFDRDRFERSGEHNLLRARGQWALHRAAAACRDERATILGL